MNKNIKNMLKNFNIWLFCLMLLVMSVIYSLFLIYQENTQNRNIGEFKQILSIIKKDIDEKVDDKKIANKILEIKKITDAIEIDFVVHPNNLMDMIYKLPDSYMSYSSLKPNNEPIKIINIDKKNYDSIIESVNTINNKIIELKSDSSLSVNPIPRINYSTPKWNLSYGGFGPVFGMLNLCFLIIIFYYIYSSFEKTSAQIYGKNLNMSKPQVVVNQKVFTFKDIAGADEEKEEMTELIDFLKNPSKYEAMGARIPKGILLYGPPGVGKTLLARAVAGEAQVPFYAVSGSEFVEMYVGLGASRIRKLFQEAKQNSPCIIFIDEIETISHKRGLNYNHSEQDQTLNQLLVEMDGFLKNIGVIVIAATNQPESLDSAITRPGRFDRHFYITLPSVKDRESILKLHSQNKKLDDDVNLQVLSQQTPGFSGAQLEAILNESALLATRRKSTSISNKDISEALDRVLMGPAKKSRQYNMKEKKMVAYHEAGHAVIGLKLPNSDQVQKVTIIPRGESGGYNLMMPETETFFSSKKRFLAQITSYLGGRVAEELIFDDVSNGSYVDFRCVTDIAKKMVTQFGMSHLGPIQYMENNFYKNYSDSKAVEIDKEIQNIINQCYQEAKQIISENKQLLELIAKYLLEIETISKKDLDEIVEKGYIEWWEKSKTHNIDHEKEITNT